MSRPATHPTAPTAPTASTAPPPAPLTTRLRWTLGDVAVLVQRSLRHAVRNVDALLTGVMLPVMMLLLFVYVFGGAISDRSAYVQYVVPGILLLCVGYGASGTANGVQGDRADGMIDRFRSLPIRSEAALAGHVVASLVRNLVSTVLVVAVALVIGFRPTGDPRAWLGALALLALYVLALSWTAVGIGLVASSPESAASFGFVLLFLPYLSSAFVAVDTLPAALRPIAVHQPVTPLTEAVRGLLVGGPVAGDALVGALWCVGLLAVVVPVTARLYRRTTA